MEKADASAATSAPVTLMEGVFGVYLKVNELRQNASVAVIDRELQDLRMAILANVTSKDKEVIAMAAKVFGWDYKELRSTLGAINEELDKITSQVPKLVNNFRDPDLRQEFFARLAKVENLIQQAINKVDDMHEDVREIKHILAESRRPLRCARRWTSLFNIYLF